MKPRVTILIAGLLLWFCTMIASFKAGHRSGVSYAGGIKSDPSAASRNADDAKADLPLRASGNQERAVKERLTVEEVFSKLKATIRPGATMNPALVMRTMALLDKLSIKDVSEAIEVASRMEDKQSTMFIQMALFAKWAEQDGPAAMKHAEECAGRHGSFGSIFIASAASSWAENDPEAVWQWYQENKDSKLAVMENPMVLSSILSNLMVSDPDTAFKRLDELDELGKQVALSGMSQVAVSDDSMRSLFLEKINSLTNTGVRHMAHELLVSQWVLVDPKKAEAWIEQQPADAQARLRDATRRTQFEVNQETGRGTHDERDQ